MSETKPRVSVIMASYNHAAYIVAAVDSVRRQDYDAWELPVADDASTDRTREVLASCVEPPRVPVFPFTVNRGYHMRNYAAARARGEYLTFLNSDDRLEPGKLHRQVEILDRHLHVAAVFTHIRCHDEDRGRRTGRYLESVCGRQSAADSVASAVPVVEQLPAGFPRVASIAERRPGKENAAGLQPPAAPRAAPVGGGRRTRPGWSGPAVDGAGGSLKSLP